MRGNKRSFIGAVQVVVNYRGAESARVGMPRMLIVSRCYGALKYIGKIFFSRHLGVPFRAVVSRFFSPPVVEAGKEEEYTRQETAQPLRDTSPRDLFPRAARVDVHIRVFRYVRGNKKSKRYRI